MSALVHRSTAFMAVTVLCALGAAAFSSTHHAGRAASTTVSASATAATVVTPADGDSQWG